MMTAFDTALDYARRGYPVFPVKTDKAPFTPNGVKDATTDEAQLQAWSKMHPGCNWGMATGEPSGVTVLDLDPRNGGFAVMEHLKREYGKLPRTVTVQTGGEQRGMHFYFRHPLGPDGKPSTRVRNVAIKPGVDVKTTGGYVIIPGSRTHGDYEFFPDRGFREEDGGQTVSALPGWIEHLCSRGTREFETDAEGKIKRGERNDFLASWAGTMRQRGASAEEIYGMLKVMGKSRMDFAETSDGRAVNLDLDDEYRKVAESIAKYEPGDPILGDPSLDTDARAEARLSERIVLGRILISETREEPTLLAVMEGLRASYFDAPDAAKAFLHVRRLWQAGGVPSRENVELSLDGEGDALPEIFLDEVCALGKKVLYPGDATFHVQQMRNGYVFREGARILADGAEKMRESRGEARDHVGAAATALLGLVDEGSDNHVATGSDMVDYVREMYHKASHGDLVMNEPTGFEELDAELDGWAVAEIAVLAARPGHGKTAATIDSSIRNARRQVAAATGKGVFFGSYEMSRRQIALRMACNIAEIDSRKIRTGQPLTPDEQRRLEVAYEELAELPIFTDDTASPTPEQVCARVLAVHSHTKLSLVVIDYIEMLGRSEALSKHVSKTEVIEEAFRQFKALAKTLDCPVIVVAQLDRAVEKGKNVTPDNPPQPRPSDLRWAGMIEQTANQIVFICYDWQFFKSGVPYAGGEPDPMRVRFLIPKSRDGGVGRVDLAFLKSWGKFGSLDNRARTETPTGRYASERYAERREEMVRNETARAEPELPWENA